MSHKPTAEQTDIIDAFAARKSLVVEAVAGAGKTSTLRMAAQAAPGRRCLYVAYNKPLAKDAERSMPGNVEARTSHSLAYRTVGYAFRHRLDAPRMSSREAARIMYADGTHRATRVLNAPVDIGGVLLRPPSMARLAIQTVKRYCESADDIIAAHHLPKVDGVDGPAREALAGIILPIAELAWKDLSHPAGKLRHEPDHYLKVWALSRPRIPADCILFDEAQDANPVLVKVLTAQESAQLVAVGDSCQQLYAWRGSVDALATWPADIRLTLSQSFRFGQAVADRANRWLDLLQAPTRVIGAPWLDSTVGPIDDPAAILCRTNAGAMREAMGELDAGRRVYLAGGGSAISNLAKAAEQLMHGEPCDHPELCAFSSWDEVRQYVTEDDGGDLAPAVKLIDDYGADKIIETAKRLTANPAGADVAVSTGHKAKGLQWPRVRIADDFKEPQPRPYPDPDSGRLALVLPKSTLMLAYVAVTRAELALDDQHLSWVDRVHGHGVPVIVVGERGAGATRVPRPEPVPSSWLAAAVREHPEAILPDSPHPLDDIEAAPEPAPVRPSWTSGRTPAPRHPCRCDHLEMVHKPGKTGRGRCSAGSCGCQRFEPVQLAEVS